MTALALALSLTIGRITTARRARRAWHAGADLTAGLAALTADQPIIQLPPWRTAPPPDETTCPGCGGRRCRHWRDGDDCRTAGRDQRPAYAAGLSLPRPGRHSIEVRVAHWAHILRLRELRDRIGIPPARVMRLP